MLRKKERGKFISIDGVEGGGKSTQIQFIKDYLQHKNIKTHLTQEPGGTQIGQKIRQLLLNKTTIITPKTESLLIFAARCEHVSAIIKPKLQAGTWVISDRFSDASYAYQGGGRGLSLRQIEVLESWSIDQFVPDLSFFLDMPVTLSQKRIARRVVLDRFEQEKSQFFERVRTTFLTRAKQYPERIVLIDATQSIEHIRQQIINTLTERFKL